MTATPDPLADVLAAEFIEWTRPGPALFEALARVAREYLASEEAQA